MKRKPRVTKEDLRRFALAGSFLICDRCFARCSANYDDYSFWRKPDEPFRCNCKGKPFMHLARVHTTIVYISTDGVNA